MWICGDRKIVFYNEDSNLWRLGKKLKELGIEYKITECRDGYEYTFIFPKESKLIEDRPITDRYFRARSVIVLIPERAKVYFYNYESFTDGSSLSVSIEYLKKNSSS